MNTMVEHVARSFDFHQQVLALEFVPFVDVNRLDFASDWSVDDHLHLHRRQNRNCLTWKTKELGNVRLGVHFGDK